MELYTDGIHIIEAIIPNTKEKLVELVKYMQGKSYMSVHNIETRSFDTVIEEAIKKGYICFKCHHYDFYADLDQYFMFYDPDNFKILPIDDFKKQYFKADIHSLRRDINLYWEKILAK